MERNVRQNRRESADAAAAGRVRRDKNTWASPQGPFGDGGERAPAGMGVGDVVVVGRRRRAVQGFRGLGVYVKGLRGLGV
jgi:hypothetical protein